MTLCAPPSSTGLIHCGSWFGTRTSGVMPSERGGADRRRRLDRIGRMLHIDIERVTPPALATIAISMERARRRFMHSTSSPAASFSFIDFSEMRSPLAIEVRRAIGCGPIAPQGQRSPRGRRGCLRRGGARVRGRRAAMGYGFPRPRPAWGRLDRLDQLGHLRRKRVPGQHRAGIDDDKQKPVILPLAARDRRPGE
jgi:hypothetical protein